MAVDDGGDGGGRDTRCLFVGETEETRTLIHPDHRPHPRPRRLRLSR